LRISRRDAETVSKLKKYPVLMIIRFLEIYLECASLLAPYSISDYYAVA
jgi:hypothetical protein